MEKSYHIGTAIASHDTMNSVTDHIVSSIAAQAPKAVVNAIKSASAKTGMDFSYLLQQAKAESAFKSDAKAKTSSATGLYQFLESTWMNMVEKYGDKHGIQTEGKNKKDILAMRNDPEKAAVMAAEFAGENERFLNTHWGGKIGATERYFAHFMGAGGAAAFLNARDENGMQAAADIFPKAARANRNVFYEQNTGRAKSLDEVYAFFDKKFQKFPETQASKPETLIALKPQSKPDIQIAENNAIQNRSIVFKQARKAYNSSRHSNSLGAFTNLMSNPVEVLLLAQIEDGTFLSKNNQNVRF